MAAPPSITSARTSVYHTANESDTTSRPGSAPTSPFLPFWTPAPQRIAVSSGNDNNDDGSDSDTTPRAAAFQRGLTDREREATGSSPVLLERYMDAHNNSDAAAAGQLTQELAQAIPTTPATPAMDTPATRTRLQERLKEFGASQAGSESARSTPVPVSVSVSVSSGRRHGKGRREEQMQMQVQTPTDTPPATAPSRSTPSPLVHKNMLLDISSQSPSYPSYVRGVISQVVASLDRRGRTKEGRALQELYKQSFKDPGTAELLDALLRRRASERQRRDFVRYVEDVDVMERCGGDVRDGEGEMRDVQVEVEGDAMLGGLGEEEVAVALPMDLERPPSPRVVIELPARSMMGEETEEVRREDGRGRSQNDGASKSAAENERERALSPQPQTKFPDRQILNDEAQAPSESNHKQVVRTSLSGTPTGLRAPAHSQQAHMRFEPQAPHNKVYDKWKRNAPQAPHSKINMKSQTPNSAKLSKITGSRTTVPGLQSKMLTIPSDEAFRSDVTAKRRRKKNKKRLFAAANGPVFSKPFKMP